MAGLSTHVLDTSRGMPAAGMTVRLFRQEDETWRLLKTVVTHADGRIEGGLLTGGDFIAGLYRLEFGVGEFYRDSGVRLPDPPFLDEVPVQIGIADTTLHYHVPLLCSPWSYSTYRGS